MKEEHNKQLKDFEVLKDIVNGKVKIEDVDIETKRRLIEMCEKRLKSLDDEIEEIRNNTREVKELTNKLKKI